MTTPDWNYLLSKSKIDEKTRCLEWQFSSNRGYGKIAYKGGQERTHRLSWMLNIGSIPKGLCVLHHCDNGLCINPDHLFLGTQADNVRDMIEKGRQGNQIKTHCKHGHILSGANLYIVPSSGKRRCKTCQRCWTLKYRIKLESC